MLPLWFPAKLRLYYKAVAFMVQNSLHPHLRWFGNSSSRPRPIQLLVHFRSLFLLEPAQSGHHKRYATFPSTSFPPKVFHRSSVKPIVHSPIEDLVTQQLQRNEMDGILQDSCPAPSRLPKSVVDGVVMSSSMQVVLF